MKNELIAKTLRYYRQQRQLSVLDVTNLLKDKEILLSPKTIYSWEKGTTQPDINTLLTLCSIYGIKDIMGTFGFPSSTSLVLPLTEEEECLIQAYRLQPQMQEAVKRLLILS